MFTTTLSRYITFFTFAILFFAGALTARAVTIYGVTSTNQLVRFNAATPGTLTTTPVTGLQPGETLVGIDFRPATGEMYALGSASRLYKVNKQTAAATLVAVLQTSLVGTEFGFDFNPVVDRIRVVSSTGQNLRVNPTNGAVIVDGALNPGSPHVTAAAYANSFSGSTSTTLYVIDTITDTLYTQNPPNAGTLVSVGGLNTDAGDANGFDISVSSGLAYSVLTSSGLTRLYTINLASGAATLVGSVGAGTTPLNAMAVDSGSSVQNLTVYGLTTTNQLVRFNSTRPNTILGTVPVSGTQPGENLVGIDFRPATGRLYGIGSASRLYTIDTATGIATQVGGAGQFTLNGNDLGFDFNPIPDRIRVVSDLDQNLRLNPNDGSLTSADQVLAYGSGDVNAGQNPNIVAAGYANSFAGATSTTLYGIDSNLDILTTQNPPNNGTLNTVGPLGVNTTANVGLDLAPGNNTALAAMQLNGDALSKLYSIDLMTGSTSFIGPVGGTAPLRGMAIVPGSAASRTVDFDGDGRTDHSVFRPSINSWLINRSSNGTFYNYQFGAIPNDILTPGDYDGDGQTDIAVWRPSDGFFYVLRSSDSQLQALQFGIAGDEPVARDYDGDGKTDFAVARRTGGAIVWYIANSAAGNFRAETFGLDTDILAPGDYDGDGRFDLGVRRGTGSQPATFYTLGSTAGFSAFAWGLGLDRVTPGDYDGDGRTDYTAVRNGTDWYILLSSTGAFKFEQVGSSNYLPAQGDYDGDGRTDVAAWNPQAGIYNVLRSSNRATVITFFGQSGDKHIAGFDTH